MLIADFIIGVDLQICVTFADCKRIWQSELPWSLVLAGCLIGTGKQGLLCS